MENSLISTRWFPAYGFCAGNNDLSDHVFNDFDRQSEQLSGHDQSYLQLTSGAFRGRFLSAFLRESVAIHMEFCNQALEQEVGRSPDHFTFGVTLSDEGHFFVKGRQLTGHDVFVLPPSGNLHMISPTNGAVMAIAVHRDLFLRQPYLTPAVLDWIGDLDGNIGILRSDQLAHRIREDAMAALEGVAHSATPPPKEVIGQALAASIASKLSLEWGAMAAKGGDLGLRSYERFQKCRRWLSSGDTMTEDTAKIAEMVSVSKRSVEQAFSSNVSMGPITYLRILRLHDVKRRLLDPVSAGRSIGDIAAEYGFWDWSRFSSHYCRHFGELPSATRRSFPGLI